jgi:hypothetical protein
MKQYLQGLGCIVALILITGIATLAGRPFVSREGMEILIGGVLILGAITLGYVYKRWNGPLMFAKDGKGIKRLFPFLLGLGTILGPVKLFLGPFPVQDVIPLVNVLLLVASVPLSGMSALGPMLVGSLFYKREPTWL